jgi:hypothetical protein
LRGPFGEVYEVFSWPSPGREHGLDRASATDQLRALQLLSSEPHNLQQLRALVANVPRDAYAWDPTPHDIARLLAQGIAQGHLYLYRQRESFRQPALVSPYDRGVPLSDLAGPPPDETPPPEPPVEKILDWNIQCKHMFDDDPRTLERGTFIQVVPDGEGGDPLKDTVQVLYRNDYTPPPGSLRAAPTGGAEISAGSNGADGAYTRYPVDVEYLGEVDYMNFLRPAYWQAFNSRTKYTIRDGPAPINVDVHYPYKWKFTFSLPPMRSFKAGAKYDEEIEHSKEKGFSSKPSEANVTADMTGWNPSTMQGTAVRGWGTATPNGTVAEVGAGQRTRAVQAIKLERSDGVEVSFDRAEMLAKFFWLANSFNRVIDSLLDVAPKVGWYADIEFQLMQGALQVQWGWKEYSDHRAYRWVDVCIELTIFSVKLEVGVGLSGLSFAAQVYVAVLGDLKVSVSGERPSPEAEASVKVPLEANIKGQVGLRFEAGYVIKIDAHGETGLRFTGDMRINDGDRPVSLNGEIKWTGLTITASVSVGLFGIGGSKTKTWHPIAERSLQPIAWPAAEKYNPPFIPRSRIQQIMEVSLTSGLNVRVFRPSGSMLKSDYKWPIKDIATKLVDKLDASNTMRRDRKTVEGMAHGIREDLDAIGARWFRDWISEDDFMAYVNGPALAKRIDEARDLGKELALQAGCL